MAADARDRLAALGEIAAELAHELRNSLQLIANDAFLARQDATGSAVHLERIARSARTAQVIVDDVMDLARGLPDPPGASLMTEVLVGAREGLPLPGATFEDSVASDSVVRGHPGLVARLLHVLYENAVLAAAPRPVRICTRASREPTGTVVVVVEDDGPGVPAHVASRIFEPLVSARPGGTGLGLALAHRIAALHGGELTLEAASPATFRVTLGAP